MENQRGGQIPKQRLNVGLIVMGAFLTALMILAPALSWAQGIVEQTRDRPPPLDVPPDCNLWKGTIRGRDPSVEVQMTLCPSGAGVSGVLQWSSERSGWNRRAVEGEWSEKNTRLNLHDTHFIEYRPQARWRFCLIDQYDLLLGSPGNLEGFYRSMACNNDLASIALQLEPGPVAPPATASAPIQGTPPPLDMPVKPRGGCSIDRGASSSNSFFILISAVGLVIVQRRAKARFVFVD